MNSFITIATKKSGTSEILAGPDVSYEKQKELLNTLGEDYLSVEMWSRSQGKIRGRKIRVAPVDKQSKSVKKLVETDDKIDKLETVAPVEKTKSGKKGK